MPDDFNVSGHVSTMQTACTTCSMSSACRDRENHRTRNILHGLIAMQNHLHATEIIVQVFPCDSKIGIQRVYPLPMDCPRTIRYGAVEFRLHELCRHRDKNVFYAVANTSATLLDIYKLIGTDGWSMAEDVPFLTEV